MKPNECGGRKREGQDRGIKAFKGLGKKRE